MASVLPEAKTFTRRWNKRFGCRALKQGALRFVAGFIGIVKKKLEVFSWRC
jgi:hypothetical protein